MTESPSIPQSMHPQSMHETAEADVLRHRPRLRGLAYRMLADVDEAEDVVQEAYLRWHQADRRDVRSPEGWLVTVVSRLAVDRLRRLATERAAYVGPWLPEPITTAVPGAPGAPAALPAPDHGAELASDLSVALLVLLERLAPEERAAFLLREVFGTDYAEIARILERRPDAVRQMVHRARARVHAGRPRRPVPTEAHARLFERFMETLAADDAPGLLALLTPEVTCTTDGGGRAAAARNVIMGPDHVARFLLGLSRKQLRAVTGRLTQLNGQPALLTYEEGRLTTATMLDVDGEGDGERIRAIYVVRNPDKLRRVVGEAPPVR